MSSFYRSVDEYPSREDANGVLIRLLDSLGYRFYWATEGLSKGDYDYCPGHGCQKIGELLKHIWGLVNWVHDSILAEGTESTRPSDPDAQRDQTLGMLLSMRQHVERIGQEELFRITIKGSPLWHVINGPLSDALTHTGQIASFRRLNGNPVPKHSVFSCQQRNS